MPEAIAVLLSALVSAFVAKFVAERSAKIAGRVARAEIRNANNRAEKEVAARLTVADGQVRAAVLAENRQAWINSLRGEMANLAAIILRVTTEMRESEDRGRAVLKENAERIMVHHMKISLMINPNETDHKDLVAMIENLLPRITNREIENFAFDWWRRDFVSRSQTILKREWERVKKLE